LLAITPRPPLHPISAVDYARAHPDRKLQKPARFGQRVERRRTLGPAAGSPAPRRAGALVAQSQRPVAPEMRTGTAWPSPPLRPSSRHCRHRPPHWGTCTERGPISSGAKMTQSPTGDHGRPAIPIDASAVAMITSQQPSSAALPAKQRADTIPPPTSRHQTAEATEERKQPAVKPGHHRMVGVAGRAPPPSRNSTTGKRSRRHSSKSRSFLRWP